jgi:hypothetical protein
MEAADHFYWLVESGIKVSSFQAELFFFFQDGDKTISGRCFLSSLQLLTLINKCRHLD